MHPSPADHHPTLYPAGLTVPCPSARIHIEELRTIVGAKSQLGQTFAHLLDVIECGDPASADLAADQIERAVRDILDMEGI